MMTTAINRTFGLKKRNGRKTFRANNDHFIRCLPNLNVIILANKYGTPIATYTSPSRLYRGTCFIVSASVYHKVENYWNEQRQIENV